MKPRGGRKRRNRKWERIPRESRPAGRFNRPELSGAFGKNENGSLARRVTLPSVKKSLFLSISDQVADHLQKEILRGRWAGIMPGKHQIAAELGVNNKTVEAALRQLEKCGLLIAQGAGRNRKIAEVAPSHSRSLRIAVFPNEGTQDQKYDYFIEMVHALENAGHQVVLASKSLTKLKFEIPRVMAMVQQTPADAWIVCAGSRAVLEWFASQPIPAFALFGHRIGIRIPGISPDKPPAIQKATRHLIELGHTRIVLLCRKIRRLPTPGLSETVFLQTLTSHGCPVGDYNLPDWEESNVGFQDCLASLFRVTPPTALIVDEAEYYVAAMQFLLRRGIRVPEDVSMICTDDDPSFAHCHPPVSCIAWDARPIVKRIVQWASNASRGKADFAQTGSLAQFRPGGTTARVKS